MNIKKLLQSHTQYSSSSSYRSANLCSLVHSSSPPAIDINLYFLVHSLSSTGASYYAQLPSTSRLIGSFYSSNAIYNRVSSISCYFLYSSYACAIFCRSIFLYSIISYSRYYSISFNCSVLSKDIDFSSYSFITVLAFFPLPFITSC